MLRHAYPRDMHASHDKSASHGRTCWPGLLTRHARAAETRLFWYSPASAPLCSHSHFMASSSEADSVPTRCPYSAAAMALKQVK